MGDAWYLVVPRALLSDVVTTNQGKEGADQDGLVSRRQSQDKEYKSGGRFWHTHKRMY